MSRSPDEGTQVTPADKQWVDGRLQEAYDAWGDGTFGRAKGRAALEKIDAWMKLVHTPVSGHEVLLMVVCNPDGTLELVLNNGDPVAVPKHAVVTVHPDRGEVHFRVGVNGNSAPWGSVRVTQEESGEGGDSA